MIKALPNLNNLSQELSHVVLLYDRSKDGFCFLGLGCKKSLELGGNISELDVLNALEKFSARERWTFGWIGYDVKNSFLNLSTRIENGLGLPDLAWWEPEVVIKWNSHSKPEVIQGDEKCDLAKKGITAIYDDAETSNVGSTELVWSWKKEEYVEKFNSVKDLIQAGDIYELNLCQTLTASAQSTNSWGLFSNLYAKTKAPFSAYLQCGNARIMSGSPERFLKRIGDKLISQPIKGTTARGANLEEDEKFIEQLKSSEKERAENIMIADLVRNDLSRVAIRDSVEVVDLCGIHTFETVHQMITEVNCMVDSKTGLSEVLSATFPMGSMTGAPKISAMKNIDLLEQKGRGVYSGSVGYISPDGDFDLNVLIRSLFHNAETEIIEASVGGAITSLSNAEDEYNECVLKAEALIKTVNGE